MLTRPIAISRVLRVISDRPTNGRTDRPMEGPTDKVAYRVACTRLNRHMTKEASCDFFFGFARQTWRGRLSSYLRDARLARNGAEVAFAFVKQEVWIRPGRSIRTSSEEIQNANLRLEEQRPKSNECVKDQSQQLPVAVNSMVEVRDKLRSIPLNRFTSLLGWDANDDATFRNKRKI